MKWQLQIAKRLKAKNCRRAPKMRDTLTRVVCPTSATQHIHRQPLTKNALANNCWCYLAMSPTDEDHRQREATFNLYHKNTRRVQRGQSPLCGTPDKGYSRLLHARAKQPLIYTIKTPGECREGRALFAERCQNSFYQNENMF